MSTPRRDGVGGRHEEWGWLRTAFIIGYCLWEKKKKKPAPNMSEVFFVEIGNKITHKSRPLTRGKWTVSHKLPPLISEIASSLLPFYTNEANTFQVSSNNMFEGVISMAFFLIKDDPDVHPHPTRPRPSWRHCPTPHWVGDSSSLWKRKERKGRRGCWGGGGSGRVSPACKEPSDMSVSRIAAPRSSPPCLKRDDSEPDNK